MEFRIVKKFETSFMVGTVDTSYKIKHKGKRGMWRDTYAPTGVFTEDIS